MPLEIKKKDNFMPWKYIFKAVSMDQQQILVLDWFKILFFQQTAHYGLLFAGTARTNVKY